MQKHSVLLVTYYLIHWMRNFSITISRVYEIIRTSCTRNNRAKWNTSARYVLCIDPVKGAFNIGCTIRWLDYNDTWLAAEWGHPSDNLGGILAVADYISRVRISEGKEPLKVREVLEMMIKAHEIQGVLALENSLNRVGLDHVLYVKVATTAVS